MFAQAKKSVSTLADVSSISKPLVAWLEPVRFLYDWIPCGELCQFPCCSTRVSSRPINPGDLSKALKSNETPMSNGEHLDLPTLP